MFGFSLSKLLVLAAIVLGVWYGYKLLGRMNAPQRKREDESPPASRVDTVYDPETDSYVVKGSETKSGKK